MNMQDVKATNKAAGQHWFDKSTMEFFNCRIETPLHAGRFFVSSEQCPWGDGYPRLFTICEVIDGGKSIDTFGEFQGFETLEAAIAAIPA